MKKYYSDLVEIIINKPTVIKATKFVGPKEIVRAVRQTYKKFKPRKGDNIQITLTIGKPNYAEREFIKKCQLAKESFPVVGVLLKFRK